MPISRISRTFLVLHLQFITDINQRTYFPSVEAEDVATNEQGTSTEPSEMLSQLPDAPTEDPKDIDDVEEPSTKKQKTDDLDDDFVVVEKEDIKDDLPKSEL
jgi:hypothetical protein